MRRFKQYTVDEYIRHLKSIKITRVIKEIHLHHTWKPTKEGYRNSKKKEDVIYGMYVYHTKTRGWSDIAQHVSLAPDGTVWDGRDINRNPASIKGYNEGAFMIEMIGNFDEGHEQLEGAQLNGVIKLVRNLFDLFKIQNLVFHREYSSKTCPGTSISKEEILEKIKGTVQEKVSILGDTKATSIQMSQYLISINSNPKLNCSVDELIGYYIQEGKIEGVRADVAFAQALKETGYFRYGGIVDPNQNNYAGLGATGGDSKEKGATFESPQIGVRAHIQHLKGYASTDRPKKEIVDPRYKILEENSLLGIAPYITDLNGKWAWPGDGYGEAIKYILNKILETKEEKGDYNKVIDKKNRKLKELENRIFNLDELIKKIREIVS